jgi:hypothetical protein
MCPIDPQDVENSLEDCARHQDQFVRTATAADDKYIVFIITGGKIPTIHEMH